MPLFKKKEGEAEGTKKNILPTIDAAKLKGSLKCLEWIKKKIQKRGAIFPICMLLLNAIYLSIGGAIFMALEAQPKPVVSTSQELVELFDILKNSGAGHLALPSQMNGADLVKNLTSEDFKKFEATLAKISDDRVAAGKPEWSIYNSIFFCMTVTTTIGYGSIAPVTTAGRIICIVYALIGIPLTLAVLAIIGKILGDYINDACALLLKWFRHVHPKYEYERTGKPAAGEESQVDAPFWLALLLLFGFTAAMAGLYCWIEGWDFGTSLYFQYITFLTIGFGDVVPQKEELVFVHMFLILTGLSVLSITLSMIATNLSHQMQKASFVNKFTDEELSDMSSNAGSAVGIGDEEGKTNASFANDDTNGGKNYGSTKGSP